VAFDYVEKENSMYARNTGPLREQRPITPEETLAAAIGWYKIGIGALASAQTEEVRLLPHGDVSTHYAHYERWTQVARDLYRLLPPELRTQYDKACLPTLREFFDEGTVTRIFYTNKGTELQVQPKDKGEADRFWLFLSTQDLAFDPFIGLTVEWNTSFATWTTKVDNLEFVITALRRRPDMGEVETLRETLGG